MKISIIVAVASDGSIGINNGLLWHLPGDLKRFKETTIGHTIIMGRNTYLSLPQGSLPNRRNIVVSTSMPSGEGIEIYSSLQTAINAVKEEEEVFIIGGAKLYETALPYADRLYLTRVEASFPMADTFFPEVDFTEWRALSQEVFPTDDKNQYKTVLTIYDRIDYFKKKLS